MKKYVKHIVVALICFLLILVLNFVLPRALSGDPIAYLTGFEEEEMSAEKYEYYYHALHLDESIWVQFGYYLLSIFDGTLGYSYQQQATVSALILEKLGYSLQITIPATLISIIIGLFWGLNSGYKKEGLKDKISTSAIVMLNALPGFAIALILAITLGVQLKWFPYVGLSSSGIQVGTWQYLVDRMYHLILPITAVVLASLPSKYLLVRNTVAKFVDDKSVSYAKQRGLGNGKIKRDYVLKNVAQPFVTMVGSSIGSCVGGAIVVESIFSIKGIGGLLNQAVYSLDYPLMQGILLITTLSIVVCVTLSDIVCILIDPRVKKGEEV